MAHDASFCVLWKAVHWLNPLTCDFWDLLKACLNSNKGSRAKRYFLNCESLTNHCSKKAFSQRRGEHSWTAADRGVRQDTEETKRLCKSGCIKLFTLFSTNLRFKSFIKLKYVVQGHPARGRKWASNGRREKRKTTKQVSFCGKLNPELISQCVRGPASQIGYQRERDVTGEFIWKE